MFDKSPSDIIGNYSRVFTLRCSLNDTTTPVDGGIVGRDITETLDNVEHVTSMIITRNNDEDVASVSQYNAAKAWADVASMNVSGTVSSSLGQRGYLALTWQYPTEAQVGEYTCEINGVNDFGRIVKFSTSLEVAVVKPTLDQLVDHVRDLELDRVSSQKKMTMLRQLVEQYKATLDQLKNTLPSIQQKTSEVSDRFLCSEGRGCEVKQDYKSPYQCYKVETAGNFTWTQARQKCESLGGFLAEIPDTGTLEYVDSITPDSSQYWLGGSDSAHEGTWKWVNSGQSLTLLTWAKGEPNDAGDEDCLCMGWPKSSDNQMYDKWCGLPYGFVCQKNGDNCDGWK